MMHIKELWRFPVKSMAGERLESVRLTKLGFEHDRNVLVTHANGRLITARTRPKLLGLKGTIRSDGETLISGHPWNSPEALAMVKAAAGADADLTYYQGAERFDILPLLVATDGAIKEFGRDSRRLRPNIIVGGVEGLAERSWPGQCLRIGDALIGVQDLRARCVMTTYDPDTLAQNPAVLKEIVEKFGGELALNCYVMRGGELRVGEGVELISCPEPAEFKTKS